LLVSFMQIWKEPGIILRAGIICALMKSISPSAVILGPMIGIFLEAFLLEASRFLLRRHLMAYVVGGALAVSSTLFQKLGMLLVTYGFDLVAIAKPFYYYLVKITKLNSVPPKYLVIGILVFYLLIGAAAAILGYLAGKNYLLRPKEVKDSLRLAAKDKQRFAMDDEPDNRYPILTILMILGSMIGSMWLINFQFLPQGIIFGGLFIGLILYKYRHALGRLKKASLWLQFFVITIVAAIFWEWTKTGNYFSVEGLMIGLKMNYRAIIVILGFTAISVELRNPLIKALLSRKGYSSLYQSLNLSFSALPAIVSALPSGKNLYQHNKGMIPNLLAQAEGLLIQFEQKNKQFDHVYVISGGVHKGKTTFAEAVVQKLRQKNIPVEGFLAHGTFAGDRRYSFHIENLKDRQRHLLCIRQTREDWDWFGSFSFDPKVLQLGNDLLKNVNPDSIVIIDEVGNFEFKQKQGWFEGLSHLLNHHPETKQIWVVRRDFIPNLQALFPIPDEHIFPIPEDTLDQPDGAAVDAFLDSLDLT
ncbi:MAG TPA: hypothetical protein ENK85_04840, partial [Saprospiraceae bacterium]|nr:hypothetical protein [Saprospiraceae bacterium]